MHMKKFSMLVAFFTLEAAAFTGLDFQVTLAVFKTPFLINCK